MKKALLGMTGLKLSSILRWEKDSGIWPICFCDNPNLTLQSEETLRYLINWKEPITALKRDIITVSILMAAISPISPEMTSDATTDEPGKWAMLASCVKHTTGLIKLAKWKSLYCGSHDKMYMKMIWNACGPLSHTNRCKYSVRGWFHARWNAWKAQAKA